MCEWRCVLFVELMLLLDKYHNPVLRDGLLDFVSHSFGWKCEESLLYNVVAVCLIGVNEEG